jgi:hypothetical protein
MTDPRKDAAEAESQTPEPLGGRLGERFDLPQLGGVASAIATVYATTRSAVAVLAMAAVAALVVRRSGTR